MESVWCTNTHLYLILKNQIKYKKVKIFLFPDRKWTETKAKNKMKLKKHIPGQILKWWKGLNCTSCFITEEFMGNTSRKEKVSVCMTFKCHYMHFNYNIFFLFLAERLWNWICGLLSRVLPLNQTQNEIEKLPDLECGMCMKIVEDKYSSKENEDTCDCYWMIILKYPQ